MLLFFCSSGPGLFSQSELLCYYGLLPLGVVESKMPSTVSHTFVLGDSEEGRMAQNTSQSHPLFFSGMGFTESQTIRRRSAQISLSWWPTTTCLRIVRAGELQSPA